MRNKLLATVLTIALMALLFTTAFTAAAEEEHFDICICLTGLLGDQSYCDLMKKAADDIMATYPNCEVKLLEATSAADFEPNIISACEGDYDLVVILANQQKEAALNVVPYYPDQKFACVDMWLSDPIPDNVMCSLSANNLGQFLAGVACALFTTCTQIDGVNEEKIVGWIGGGDSNASNDFWVGFEQGVKYIDPEITILKGFVGTWTDPLKGKELALAQYEQGADIIAQVASASGLGVLEAAGEQELFAVGVDSNQDAVVPGYVLTSHIKNIDVAAFDIMEKVITDTWEGGTLYYLDIENGGVSLSDFSVFKEAWGDKFPQSIVDKCNEVAALVADGTIEVDMQPGLRPWY